MGSRFPELSDEHTQFIQQQRVFFVGTAAADGRVNVSPKGMDTLRVLEKNRILWMNLTGSGNETAAHILENHRMTLMFCAFEGSPLILRVYGHVNILHPRDAGWSELGALFPPSVGARQLVDMEIDLVQTSCGMGVPVLDFKEERQLLSQYYEHKGADAIVEYWGAHNQESLDGKPTRILAKDDAVTGRVG
jgi:hypothetical protein